MRQELSATLAEMGHVAGDVAFAGSGEPTWPSEFPEALGIARGLARDLARRIPLRVFTCGARLDAEPVAVALEALVRSSEGEVWVKLDTWDEGTIARFWSSRGQAEHEGRVIRFGRRAPVVLQTMLVRRPGDATVEETASGLAAALERLLHGGCRVERVVLSTLLRDPGTPADLLPYGRAEMEQVAETLCRCSVPVSFVANRSLGV